MADVSNLCESVEASAHGRLLTRWVQCEKINKTFQQVNDGLVMKNVAEWFESKHVDHRPDLGVYSTDPQAAEAYKPQNTETRVDSSRQTYRARMAWAWLKCVGELKNTPVKSGYLFNSKGYLHNTLEGFKARAQIIKYATEMLYRQHRIHLFTFYGLKTQVRLMRWDRNGLVMSEPIDLLKNPEQFLNFFYRMAAMLPEDLGYDTTAMLASEAEVDVLRQYKLKNKDEEDMLANAISKPKEYPIYKVRVMVNHD